MARYQIISWHGIPTGVKAVDVEDQVRKNLERRFQVAVDAVATATDRIDTASYLAGWSWSEPVEREGQAKEVAQAVATELEATYSPKRIKEIRQDLEKRLVAEEEE